MVEDGQERDLVISDGAITDIAPIAGAEPDASGWVVPGLVDLHNHLSLASPVGDGEDAQVRVRASASLELAVGVLALREPGSPDEASRHLAREDGWPTVITAGRFLAPPDGYFPGLARHVTADRLETAAIEELRRSGRWVKIIGDYLGADRFVPNWMGIGFEGSPRAGTFDHLVTAVQRCIDAGAAPRGNPFAITTSLWTGLHGIVSPRLSKPGFPWPPLEGLADRPLTGVVGDGLPKATQPRHRRKARVKQGSRGLR
jgi:hypothetical protein